MYSSLRLFILYFLPSSSSSLHPHRSLRKSQSDDLVCCCLLLSSLPGKRSNSGPLLIIGSTQRIDIVIYIPYFVSTSKYHQPDMPIRQDETVKNRKKKIKNSATPWKFSVNISKNMLARRLRLSQMDVEIYINNTRSTLWQYFPLNLLPVAKKSTAPPLSLGSQTTISNNN